MTLCEECKKLGKFSCGHLPSSERKRQIINSIMKAKPDLPARDIEGVVNYTDKSYLKYINRM